MGPRQIVGRSYENQQVQRGVDDLDLVGARAGKAGPKSLPRVHWISLNNLCRMKFKDGGKEVSDTPRLKQLGDGHLRLTRLLV